ncbi:MAG TPA: PH domain-containing protein [Thermoanaerobaculia bacterium]|nr:PH domain-containing protein [Thermoanaerobaculia bacterium]
MGAGGNDVLIFRSRYDLWLKIIFAITNVMLLGALIVLLIDGTLGSVLVALFNAAILGGVIWMQAATYYRIDDDGTLFVRCGPLHWTIPIASISNMTLTDDPTSGPALSLQRVRVEFTKNGEKDEILLSPEDREGFIREVQARGVFVSPTDNLR